MPVRSAYEIAATSTELGIIQEGYLYRGDEAAETQYLVHNTTVMEDGRVFLLYDYDTPDFFGRHAQIIRFDNTGWTAGPDLDIGPDLRIYSAGSGIDGCYLGDGYVLIATLRVLTGYELHLFRVAPDDTVALLHSVLVPTARVFYHGVSVVALDGGEALMASGTGSGPTGNAKYLKVNVVDDQINVLANIDETGNWRPGVYPIRLSGNRVLYTGDRYTGGSPVVLPTYRLLDATTMTFLAELQPDNTNWQGFNIPSVAIDDNRVFIGETVSSGLSTSGYRTRLYDFTNDTFAFTPLPTTNWPKQVEWDVYPSPYVDPSRPPQVNEQKWLQGHMHGGTAVLDPETIVWVAPAGGDSVDANETVVFYYKWQTSEAEWVLTKEARKSDDPDDPDVVLMNENINWTAPLNQGATLVIQSVYSENADGWAGSIWITLVGLPSSQIVSGPRNIKARFWQ